MTAASGASVRRYEERLIAAGEPFYDLTLYVSGASDLAARAIVNARHLCEGHLAGHSRLSVVDVQDDIAAVHASGILATPTLVKNLPLPSRKVVGDLSHTARVILGLDLPFTSSSPADDAPLGA
jgi:circadian clock protein KaiB